MVVGLGKMGFLTSCWRSCCVWLLAAPPAFLINAIFDPALDGPHSGIWLFTIVGVGAAHVWLLRATGRGVA